MDIIREAADSTCSDHLVNSISSIDNILINAPSFFKRQLKNLFGLADLEHDEDFASVLEVSYYPSYAVCMVYKNLSHRVRCQHGKPNAGILNLAVLLLTSSVKHSEIGHLTAE
jgi:hypothetical protein